MMKFTLREDMARLFVDPETGEDLQSEGPPNTFETGYSIVIGKNERTGRCWRWTWKCDETASYTERIGRLFTGDYEEGGGNDSDFGAAVLHLYRARQHAARAKKARAEARSKAGECGSEDYHEEGPCWIRHDGYVCEACAIAIPATKEYWRKAGLAGAALRAVLREGKRLAQQQEGDNANPTA